MEMLPKKIQILHVEDRAIDADQVNRILKKAALNVDIKVVSTRATYVAALSEFKPDLIISDHNLPAFNSNEALALLKKSRLRIPFVLFTGTVSEEFAVEIMREGADDYVLKDRPKRLPIAVSGALEKFRLEREQRKTEIELLNIDNNSHDIICTMDEEGRFIHISAASLPMWGYTPGELEGKKYIDLVFSEDVPLTNQVAAAIMTGTRVAMFENRYVRKDGSIISVMWSVRWEATEKVMYCVARDATEKNKMEKQRKLAEAETLSLVATLQSKNNDLQQFSYIVSHNLRSPIAKILGLASIIGSDAAENKYLIEKIKEAAFSLDEVVKDINVIVSARKTEKQLSVMYFRDKLRKVEQLLELEIEKSKPVITSDFSECDSVFTVPSYMLSIIYNLVSNAIKYRRPDITLKIHIACTQDEKVTCISVRDNGMGIDLVKNKDKIFGLYKRFHGDAIQGKGIGLNLVKTHAESLGGHVQVESMVNEGTTFRIYIPKNNEKHAA